MDVLVNVFYFKNKIGWCEVEFKDLSYEQVQDLAYVIEQFYREIEKQCDREKNYKFFDFFIEYTYMVDGAKVRVTLWNFLERFNSKENKQRKRYKVMIKETSFFGGEIIKITLNLDDKELELLIQLLNGMKKGGLIKDYIIEEE